MPVDDRSRRAGRFSIMGVRTTLKVPAAETGGQFSMVEQVAEPGAASLLQTSSNVTKVFYVAAGEFEFLLGGVTRQAASGDTVMIPAGAIHRFRNVGPTPGRLFVTFTPGGHEEYLRELSDLYQDEEVLSEELRAIAENYGVEML